MMFDKKILAEPQIKAAFNGDAIPKVIEPLVDALNQLSPVETQAAIANLNEGSVDVTILNIATLQALAARQTDIIKTVNKILAVLRINGDISK